MRKKVIEMIENFVINVMKMGKIPGLSLGIIEEGETEYANGFGARNLEENLPMTADTLFGIGSTTKSFTAMSIMQLVEQGKIDLNAPLKDFIDFRLGSKKNPMTVHHALSHSTGLPALNGSVQAITRGLGVLDAPFPMSTKKDFLFHMNGAANEVFSEPGLNFFYNNDMFTLLGLIVESVSGLTYEEYVKKNILKPLEMKRSLFSREDFEKAENKIIGYIQRDPKEPSLRGLKPPFDKFIFPPGGLISSINEMLSYMKLYMNDGILNGNQVLQKTSIDLMWGQHTEIPDETSYLMTGKGYYGYAWINENFFDTMLIHHGGNIMTSSAMCAMLPEKKMGVIIGVNREPGPSIRALTKGILGVMLGKDINQAVPLLTVQKKVEKLTGKYQLYNGLMPGEVVNKNGVLFFKMQIPIPGSQPMEMPLVVEDLNELKFYVPIVFPGQKFKVQFFVNETTGKVKVTGDRYCWHKIE